VRDLVGVGGVVAALSVGSDLTRGHPCGPGHVRYAVRPHRPDCPGQREDRL